MVLFQKNKKRRDTSEESLSPTSLSPEFCHIPYCQPVRRPSQSFWRWKSEVVWFGRKGTPQFLSLRSKVGLSSSFYLMPCSLIKNNGIWVFCGMGGSSFPPSEGPPAQDWALWMVSKMDSLQRPHISLIPMETSPLRRCRLNLCSWCVFLEQPGPLLLPPSPPPGR